MKMAIQVMPGLFQTLPLHTMQFTWHWSPQELLGYAPPLFNFIPSGEYI